MIVPEAGPALVGGAERHRPQIRGEAMLGQPVARRLDEFRVLLEADEAAAARHLQRAGNDQGRGAGAEFDDRLRPGGEDMIGHQREKAGVRLPASKVRQGIPRQAEPVEQRPLVGLAAAAEASQQPRPLDRPESKQRRPVARGPPGSTNHPIFRRFRQEARLFAGCHQSEKGSRTRIVSSRSGLVETSATGVRISSSTRRIYLIAWAGSCAQLRAPAVDSDQPATVS